MDIYIQGFEILFLLLSLIILIFILFKFVMWARKGSKGAIIAGALFTMFAPDPNFEKNIKTVQESKEYMEETEDEFGGPPTT